MIENLVNKIIGSLNNLPADYKVSLIRIFQGIIDGLKHLDEIKVDKEDGKGLSSNDFTDGLKDKLDGIEPGATVQVPSDWESITGVTRILNKPDLRVYPDSAEWDSTDKKIYFKHQGTIINAFTIDGTDFIKDGMIDTVKIENDDLVITFNTEAGKEDIHIPLSEVFNPDNYYTKAKIDELFVKKVNGKGLSTEDFTTELKEKLENLEGVQSDWQENNVNKSSYIKNRTHYRTPSDTYGFVYLKIMYGSRQGGTGRVVDYGFNNLNIMPPHPYDIVEVGRIITTRYYDENNDICELMFEYMGNPTIKYWVNGEFVGESEDSIVDTSVYPNMLKEFVTLNLTKDNVITVRNFTLVTEDHYNFIKLDKNYLPNDVGVEGITDEEIDELINE